MHAFILFLGLIGNLSFAQGAQLSVSLYDQTIYFLGDEIQIKITIKNASVDTYQFKVADNRVFSFDFLVTTSTARPENYHSQKFVSLRNSSGPVFYRDISLAPGEEYSLVLGFKDFIGLPANGTYNIQAVFFPGLYINAASASLLSNKIQVNVRPATATAEQRGIQEAQIARNAQRQNMPPDEVVSFMLKARMTDQWEKFFLYINLEKLYVNSYLKTAANIDQYNRLSEEEKFARVNQFKKLLISGGAGTEMYFVLKAHDFRVISTQYDRFSALVKVWQEYQHPDFKEPRNYTYTLRRDNETSAWEIVDYVIENANTGR